MSDDDSSRTAEVLRLRYAEDLSTRAIGRKLNMARKTVRAVLGVSKRETREPTRARRLCRAMTPQSGVLSLVRRKSEHPQSSSVCASTGTRVA